MSERDLSTTPERVTESEMTEAAQGSAFARGAWKLGLKRAAGKFSRDGCTDLAAALTYFAVLSLFPALLAVVSLLGVFGQGEATVDAVMEIIEGAAPEETLAAIRGPIDSLVNTPAAGFALVTGVAGALWSASGYVGAFARAMNRIYGVEEGRPFWKLKPSMLLLTAVMVVLICIAGLLLVVSGPVAAWIGDLVGLGETAVMVWGIAKWPVLVLVVVLILAILYGFAPNIRKPKFRWLSIGAVVALLVWGLAILISIFQNDFGPALLLFGTVLGMLYMATGRSSWLVVGLGLAVVGAWGVFQISDKIQDRFTNFIDPLATYEEGTGYQLSQALFGMSFGGLTGTGLGEGYPQNVPVAYADFIMSSIGEELGFVGLAAVLMLFAVFVTRGFIIALKTPDSFGKLVAAGLSLTLAIQVFVVTGGISKLLPMTGLTTPFMSHGGSSLLANYILLAILLKISHDVNTRKTAQQQTTDGDARYADPQTSLSPVVNDQNASQNAREARS